MALIPINEYLGRSYEPNTEYIDGVLRPKPWPDFYHAKMEKQLCMLIDGLGLDFDGVPEQTVRIGETKCLILDVAVQRLSELQQPYPTRPIHLCIEVESIEDCFEVLVAKCESYHAWGVKFCWIVDPRQKRAWQYNAGDRPREIPGSGQITAGPIVLNVDDLFVGF